MRSFFDFEAVFFRASAGVELLDIGAALVVIEKRIESLHCAVQQKMLSMAASAQAATVDGKTLLAQNCAARHGDTGHGGNGEVGGPKLLGNAANWSLKLFRRALFKGKDDERKALDPSCLIGKT